MDSPRNINELLKQIRLEQTKGYCAHPDAGPKTCSGQPTDAHTVQKEGGLRAIAEEGHVVSVKKAAFNLGNNQGQIIPVPDGISNASTFPGFCNAHDAMFHPAEQKTVALGREVAFLLSYRAIVYEMLMKEAALRSNEVNRQEADKGRPFAEQSIIQNHLYHMKQRIELGLKDVTSCKAGYDIAYHASCAGFNFYAVEFASVLPVVSCGAFAPDFELFGAILQSLADSNAPLDLVAVNLTVLNDRSVLLLGWIKSGGASEKFAESFIRLPASGTDCRKRIGMPLLSRAYFRRGQRQSVKGVATAAALMEKPLPRRPLVRNLHR